MQENQRRNSVLSNRVGHRILFYVGCLDVDSEGFEPSSCTAALRYSFTGLVHFSKQTKFTIPLLDGSVYRELIFHLNSITAILRVFQGY